MASPSPDPPRQMCILFLRQFDKDSYPFKFVIAFNRDENVERPTVPLHRWELSDGVAVYSGIDKERSGTWLAVSSDGRFCCITNNREIPCEFHSELSRGIQVVDFFRHPSNSSFTEHLISVSDRLLNSNFVFGSLITGSFYYCEVKKGSCRSGPLDLACSFVLANGSIDTEWPKQQRGHRLFDAILSRPGTIDSLTESLLELLRDRTECLKGLPTNTALRPEDEKRASAIFVDPFDVQIPGGETVRMATRTSTLVITSHDCRCWITEETPGLGRTSLVVDFDNI